MILFLRNRAAKAALVCSLLLATFSFATFTAHVEAQLSHDQITAKSIEMRPSIVSIEHKVGNVRLSGTGFFVSKNGYILTSNHVVKGADDYTHYTVQIYNGKSYKGYVVYRDPKSDLAIVKIDETDLIPVTIGSSDDLLRGDTVISFGYDDTQNFAKAKKTSVANAGEIIEVSDYEDHTTVIFGVIEMDGVIDNGDSGGPVIDSDGEVVGVNVAGIDSENKSYAVQIDNIALLIRALLQ